MGQDYLNEVRTNLAAAAARKQAERELEAKAQRSAKFGMLSFLVVVITLIAIFGNHLT